ncbi:hypothetical protein [Jiangella muralis]|uniref:hypothetical protein n=1 Tax=Jiangella muralis TaxID=702383 RepID=UPI00069E647A|nr:hypothetical protein [Jiangella muralis]
MPRAPGQPADEALSGVDGLAGEVADAGSAGLFGVVALVAEAGSAGEFAEVAEAGSAGSAGESAVPAELAVFALAGSAGELAEFAEFADDGAEEPDDTSAAGACAPLRMGAATALPAPRPSAAMVPTASHVFFWSFIVVLLYWTPERLVLTATSIAAAHEGFRRAA